MTAYRAVYPRPSRYRRGRYLSRRRSGAPVPAWLVIAGAVALAGAGAGTKAAVSHGHAKAAGKSRAGGSGVPVAGGSETAFIAAVLADLGAPDTAADQESLASWFRHEYPSWPAWARDNPMSSTLPMPGAWVYNTLAGGTHVWNYPNAAEGARATALTLEDGYYPRTVSALRSGAGMCGNTSLAGELLTWSGNGYSEVC